MKRDMDLVRKILMRIEEQQNWCAHFDMTFEGHTEEVVSYNVMLMAEAGLIKAIDMSGMSDLTWFPRCLTWEGHEFLEAAKDETRWKHAKELMQKTGGFVLEVAKPLLIELMKSQLKTLVPAIQ